MELSPTKARSFKNNNNYKLTVSGDIKVDKEPKHVNRKKLSTVETNRSYQAEKRNKKQAFQQRNRERVSTTIDHVGSNKTHVRPTIGQRTRISNVLGLTEHVTE